MTTLLSILAAILLLKQPAAPPTTRYLDLLIPAHRQLMETHAKHFHRFPDGSLWSNRVESDRKKLAPKARAQAAYSLPDAPMWHCPSNNTRASTIDAVFDRLDQADVKAQLAATGGRLFTNAEVVAVTEEGILAEYDSDAIAGLMFLPNPGTDVISKRERLATFSASPTAAVFFRMPWWSNQKF